MKTNYALVTGLFIATGLMAQTNSTPMVAPPTALRGVPEVAPAATNAPAAKVPPKGAAPAKKSAAKPFAKPAPKKVEKTVALMPGTATVNATHVNVRGRSTILSERLSQLNKGETVTVIEQVENKWAKGDDLKQWAHIVYPSNAPVWVYAKFIDASNSVAVPKLNLRGGPSENFSVVGRLTKGATVKQVQTKGEWMQIEAPPGCSVFVGAIFLAQDTNAIVAANTVPTTLPPDSTNVITDVETTIPPVADAATTNAALAELQQFANELGTNAPPVVEEPLPPRVVMREGVVNNATSIQAPSVYGLSGMDTGRTINYLHTTSTNVDLFNYVGRHVIVAGEESLDERWPNTPVLTLQRIQVIDDKEK